jgi:cytochrome c
MLRTAIAVATVILGMSPAIAAGDPAAGEIVFKKCATCHAVGEGAKTKVGPVLNGVFGRTAGTLEGYKYSKAMIDAGAGGLVWTPETVQHFLAKPRDFVKGTKMTFPGLPNPQDEENVIAYLLTFSPDFVLPPPPAQ